MRPMTLSPDEIREITGRVKYQAQVRVLHSMRIPVQLRPDGSPVVARQAAESALGVPAGNQKRDTVMLNLGAI